MDFLSPRVRYLKFEEILENGKKMETKYISFNINGSEKSLVPCSVTRGPLHLKMHIHMPKKN